MYSVFPDDHMLIIIHKNTCLLMKLVMQLSAGNEAKGDASGIKQMKFQSSVSSIAS